MALLKIFLKFLYVYVNSAISLLSWKRLYRLKEIKLELGSGPKKGLNGYVTVDIRGADLCRNLKKGIPLKDQSVTSIYSSHMLEHLSYKDIMSLLNECNRVLKKGGTLSICVPDAHHYILAYIQKREFIGKDLCYQPAVVETGSYIDQVNYIAYMDGHHSYMFDEQNLVNT
jgi:predicted SAM-dependent methyltransferase